ncbi:hypothetical protein H7U19_06695 [Hyunsoonleella sp. SJ7]|uniref:DUF4843 domain-containing protein n=1 Tax=Hyunsoonleella aquatilis TaxID=2762758 RepID=A0A923H7J0_9FLAO|nr:hypothetical protein [Hyunsoonleella aquatilis]MBC3758086.1 hypothetical protein [Hyunsoonleella aquatilis]
MKKTIKAVLFLMVLTLFNCKESQDFELINYIAFENTVYDFGVDIQGSSTNQIKVYTTQLSGSDRQFSVEVDAEASSVDPSAYTVPSTVIVPANTNVGELPITISDINISAEGETLVLVFKNEDGLFIGEPITLNIKQICPVPETTLSITFDGFPEEQAWELYDASDSLLFSGGPYPDQTEFSQSFCLQSGTYKLIMLDAFGDGGGPYTITNNDNVIISGDGAYGFGEEQTFQIN